MSISEGERTTAKRGIPTDTFGRRLMLARDYAGNLSIRDAADLCDIGRGAWTNWERGARPIEMLEVAEIISEKLGVDYDWLLHGGPLAKPEPRRRDRRGRSTELLSSVSREAYSPVGMRPGTGRPPGRPQQPGVPRRPRPLAYAAA